MTQIKSYKTELTKGTPLNHGEVNNSTLIFENFITKNELAFRMKFSISYIEKLMAKGIPFYKEGRMVRFRYSEVVAWFERRSKRP